MKQKKVKVTTIIPAIDFEHLGYETALQSRDQAAAEQICGLHIHAFADELRPEISDLDGRIDTNEGRTRRYIHIFTTAQFQ